MRPKNQKKMSRNADLTKSRPKNGKSAPETPRTFAVQRQVQRTGEKYPHPKQSSLPEIASKARSGHLLYGYHAVLAALENPHRKSFHLFLSRQAATQLEKVGQMGASKSASLPRTVLDRRQLDQMVSRTSSAHNPQSEAAVHQGFILHCAPLETSYLEEWLLGHQGSQGPTRLMILDQVTDPRNIGAIMRSALALGASAILMTDRHAPEESAVLAKTAAGALEKLTTIRVTNLARALAALGNAGFVLIGLEAGGDMKLETFANEQRLGLVLGSEGAGMRRLTKKGCDHLAAIDISGDSESLNVSVAAAIALYATQFKD